MGSQHLDTTEADSLSAARTLIGDGNPLAAVTLLEKLVATSPSAANYILLCSAYDRALKPRQAVAAGMKAVALDPNNPDARHKLAYALLGNRSLSQALHSLKMIASCGPGYYASAFDITRHVCDWRMLDGIEPQLVGEERNPFSILSQSDSLADLRAAARRFSRRWDSAITPLPARTYSGRPERIRLGYLSYDFRPHPMSSLIAAMIERHDRARFEVIGYSSSPDDESPIRARLSRAFDRFENIHSLTISQTAQRIHAEEVDILVELGGHTYGSRIGSLAWRPAPVQVHYLGFPSTVGSPDVDYLIADSYVAPPQHAWAYDENLVYMPDTYWCDHDERPLPVKPPERRAHGLPDEGFVFCCLNGPHKITPEIFGIWMRLLSAVPHSVLWLYTSEKLTQDNLRHQAQLHAVEPRRLIFAKHIPHDEHLLRYHLADLFLDTYPYGAHTTAADALWAGVPVVTMVGPTFPSRVAGSMLRLLGLPELITDTPQDYEALALQLSCDRERLQALRTTLAERRRHTPLFDATRFTRSIEHAYESMFARVLRGEPPGPISILPEDVRP